MLKMTDWIGILVYRNAWMADFLPRFKKEKLKFRASTIVFKYPSDGYSFHIRFPKPLHQLLKETFALVGGENLPFSLSPIFEDELVFVPARKLVEIFQLLTNIQYLMIPALELQRNRKQKRSKQFEETCNKLKDMAIFILRAYGLSTRYLQIEVHYCNPKIIHKRRCEQQGTLPDEKIINGSEKKFELVMRWWVRGRRYRKNGRWHFARKSKIEYRITGSKNNPREDIMRRLVADIKYSHHPFFYPVNKVPNNKYNR